MSHHWTWRDNQGQPTLYYDGAALFGCALNTLPDAPVSVVQSALIAGRGNAFTKEEREALWELIRFASRQATQYHGLCERMVAALNAAGVTMVEDKGDILRG